MAVKVIFYNLTAEAGKSYGSSEVHYWLPSSDLDACQVAAKNLAIKRIATYGDGVVFLGFRMSVDQPTPRPTRFVPWSSLVGAGNGAGSGAALQDEDADIPNTCILLRMGNNNQKWKNMYFNSIPDSVIVTKPVGPDMLNPPNYGKLFASWKLELCNGQWGFKGRVTNPTKTQVLDWVQEQNGTGKIGAVVATDIASAGDQIQVRKTTAVNDGLPIPRGIWRIASEVSDAGPPARFTYYLRNSETLAATNVDEPGEIELVQYATFAYTDVLISGQTSRKRGVGSIRARGRSRNRRRTATS